MRSFAVRPSGVAMLMLTSVLLTGCAESRLPPIVRFPPPPAITRVVCLGPLDAAPIDPPPRDAFRRWLLDLPGFLQTPLARPLGLAAWRDRLYVCDAPAGELVVFDFEQQTARSVSGLPKPAAVAVDSRGEAFVACSGDGGIHVFNRSLEFVRRIASPSHEFRPAALALTGDRLIAGDVGGNRVWSLEIAGGRWTELTLPAHGPVIPGGVAESDGRIWLADSLGGGLFVRRVVGGDWTPLTAPGELIRPKQLAFSPGGVLGVPDAARQAVQLRDADGRGLTEIADSALIRVPAGVCFSTELARFYRKRVPAGVRITEMMFVSNQIGPPCVMVFACAFGPDSAGANR